MMPKEYIVFLLVCFQFYAASAGAEDAFTGLPPRGELRDFLKPPPRDAQPHNPVPRQMPGPEGRAQGGTEPEPPQSGPAVIRVGPGGDYATPGLAARFAREGDVIEIDARGDYEGDEAVWRARGLRILGVGGRPHVYSRRPLQNGKALWVIRGTDVTVENIEFSGAKVPDRNGAGIRQEGNALTIRHCYFHHNEMGVLVSNNNRAETLIEYSEFYDNSLGANSPQNGRIGHNIYIGRSRSFTLRFSYVHHGRVGHNVKTRSQESRILYNRIMDERGGRASYQIDFPDGGLAYVIGNVIQQGKNATNWALIAYGLESLRYRDNALLLVNNTLVNDRNSGQFVNIRSGVELQLLNNILAGKGKLPALSRLRRFNLVKRNPAFIDRAGFDYRLKRGAAAIDRGIRPGVYHGVRLLPEYEYRHLAKSVPRSVAGALDQGAFEFGK